LAYTCRHDGGQILTSEIFLENRILMYGNTEREIQERK